MNVVVLKVSASVMYGMYLHFMFFILPTFMPTGISFSSFRSSVRLSFVRSFNESVCSLVYYLLPSREGNLRQSFWLKFLKVVYNMSATTYQKAFIFGPYINLEGWHSVHDSGSQGPCPGMWLQVNI